MKKRLLSMLMVLAMTLTFMAPAAMAAGLESGSNPMSGGEMEEGVVFYTFEPDEFPSESLFAIRPGTFVGPEYKDQLDDASKAVYAVLLDQLGNKTQSTATFAGTAAASYLKSDPLTYVSYKVMQGDGIVPSVTAADGTTYTTHSSDEFNAWLYPLVASAYLALTNDHPEMPWMRANSYAFSTSLNKNGTSVTGYPQTITGEDGKTYQYTATQYTDVTVTVNSLSLFGVPNTPKATFDPAVTAAITGVNTKLGVEGNTASAATGKTRHEIVKAIHDYVCNLITYDLSTESPFNQTAFSGLVEPHKTVCAGYAKSFKVLCDKYGVPCVLVSGTGTNSANNTENHEWNYVQMEDGWYAVDCTWDDQTTLQTDYLLSGSKTPAAHFSNKMFEETHHPDGTWAASVTFPYPKLEENAYVPKTSLTEGMVELNKESAIYNGSNQTPTVTVKDGETELNATDYTVTITSNGAKVEEVKNAGTYTIAVTGTGSYTGTVEKKFTIEKATPTLTVEPADTLELKTGAMGNLKITLTGEGGDNLTPTVTSSNPNVAAVEQTATDCTVTAKAKGNATITVAYAGDTNYNAAESETVTVTVTDLAVKSIAVTTPPTKAVYTYGESFVGTGLVVTITYDDNSTGTADYSADMKVTPDLSTVELSEVGADGSVELTLSYQEQTAKFNVKLSAKDLADTVVSQPADATYDGTPKTPEVTVTDGGKTLRKDTDYTVAYGTNTDAGNGTVTVTGMNNYSGTVTRTFSIAQATPDIGTVKLAEEAVVYATTAPGDVELTRTDETIPGTLKLTAPENFTGKGGTTVTGTWTFTPTGTAANNYTTATGTVSIPVTDRVVEKIEVATSPETNYVYGDAFVPDGLVIKVTYNNGQTENITYGADKGFEFAPTALGDVGTKNVTVTYSKKTVDISVTVTAKPLTGAEVTVAAGSVYNGSAQEPAVTVKLDNKTLTKGTDYTVAYTGNTDAGTNTATATVTGTGNYKETASATFSIAQATPNIGTVKLAEEAVVYATTAPGDVELTRTDKTIPGTLKLTAPENFTGKGGTTVTGTWTFTPTGPAANNYTTATGTVSIPVTDRVVEKIEVATSPETNYVYGDAFVPDGLVIKVTYNNGQTEDITYGADKGFTFAPTVLGDVGTKNVTVTYSKKTVDISVTVTQKELDLTGLSWSIPASLVYDGSVKTVTLTGTVPAELEVTLSGNTGANAGDYTARAAFTVKTGYKAENYNITNTPGDTGWSIAQADPAGSNVNLTVSISDTAEKTVSASDFTSVPGTLELKGALEQITVFETGYPKFENGGVTVKLAAELATESACTVTIPVTFKPTDATNYNGADWNLVVKITTKDIPTVSVADYTKTYDKTAVTIENLSKTVTGDITGTWTFAGTAPVNAGTYTCKLNFTPTGEAANTYDEVQTAAFTITINKASATVTANDHTVTVGDALPAFGCTVSPADVTLSPAPTVSCAAEDSSTAGTYPITVTGPATSSDGNYSITYTNGTLTVSPATIAVTGVTLSPSTLSLTEGGTGALTASVAPAGATNRAVTWSSSDPSVATISNGTVTALRAGTAVITVTTEDGGFTATCTVTVSASSEAEEPVYPVSPNRPSYPGTTDTGNTDTNNNTTTPSNPPAVTDSPVVTPSAPVNNGTAEAVVSKDMADQLVEQAASGSDTVVIAPVVTGSVSQTEVTIPASAVSGIAGSSNAELRVETPAADITIPNSALADLGRQGGSVVVTAGESNGIVSIEITANGKTVDQVPGGVKAEIPVSCTPGTVAMVIDENGDLTPVRKSYADDNGRTMTVPLEGSAQMVFVDNSKSFNDVASTSWAADAVAFASSRELMNGVGSDNFSPNTTMTRGMLAVVLHNLEGNPSATYSGSFSDVGSSAWYAQAVQWAADNSIIGGVGEGMFAPDAPITREQLVVMLYRYAGQPTASGSLGSFSDSGSVSGWAQQAMAWAVANGIINGSNGALNPQSSATRAEVAQMLMNFVTSGVI